MLKPFGKLVLFGLLSATLALSAGSRAIEDGTPLPWCGDATVCVDNGCSATGGVCASFTKNGACFCAFPNQS